MFKRFSTTVAIAMATALSLSAPALAQDFSLSPGEGATEETFPRLEVHGYNEIYFHIHDINKLTFGPGGMRRDGLYVGLTRLTAQPHFNPTMSGFWEFFFFPKDRPASYVNQMDIVGNGATPELLPVLGIGTGRVQVSVRDFLWGGNTLTLGQMRVPFGNWDEFSVHRNFVTVKNHPKTLGLLLRRLDLGVGLEGDVAATPLNYRLAFMNRSDSPLTNNNNLVDLVGRVGVDTDLANVGLNVYVPDMKDAALGTKGAASVDFTVPVVERVNLLGEYVRQQSPVSSTDGLYGRLNYDASDFIPGMRFYGGIDWVNFQGTAVAEVPSTGPRNLQEQMQLNVRDSGTTYALGLRYRFLPSATFGTDYFYGDPQYKNGHLHFRLETYF